MKRWRFFLLPVLAVAIFLSGCFGTHLRNFYELARLENTILDVPNLYDADSEMCSFSEQQKRATVIIAVPDELVSTDDKRNDEFARSMLLRGNEWRQVNPRDHGVGNKWFKHTVRVYLPPLASASNKKIVSAEK